MQVCHWWDLAASLSGACTEPEAGWTQAEVSPSFMGPRELLHIWDLLHAASCPSSDLWKLQEQLLIISAPCGLSSSCPTFILSKFSSEWGS